MSFHVSASRQLLHVSGPLAEPSLPALQLSRCRRPCAAAWQPHRQLAPWQREQQLRLSSHHLLGAAVGASAPQPPEQQEQPQQQPAEGDAEPPTEQQQRQQQLAAPAPQPSINAEILSVALPTLAK